MIHYPVMAQKKALYVACGVAIFAIVLAWISTHPLTHTATPEATPETNILAKEREVALTNEDHILGNPNALIFLVVYTDLQCPFCAEYHETIEHIMRLYGTSGDVAVVYRHMPLVQLHPHSPTYHMASECVYESAGDAGFWHFVGDVFTHSDTKAVASSTLLTELAVTAGAQKEHFVTCMKEERHASKVQKSFDAGWEMKIRSTPYTVLLTPYQEIVLNDIRSFTTLGATIETILRALRNDPRLQNTTSN